MLRTKFRICAFKTNDFKCHSGLSFLHTGRWETIKVFDSYLIAILYIITYIVKNEIRIYQIYRLI